MATTCRLALGRTYSAIAGTTMTGSRPGTAAPAPEGQDNAGDTATLASYRELMSTFFTGVTVVTTFDAQGVCHGMTCTALTSVTVEPPTLLVCLNSASGTLNALMETNRFAVNILHHNATHTAEFFGTTQPRHNSPSRQQRSPLLGQPWLQDDSLAMAECNVTTTHTVGTHTVVFGEVLGVEIDNRAPLVYGYRRYHRIPETIRT
ncbi:flavin reductase family protein [Mycolicibacterium cosmeticum]